MSKGSELRTQQIVSLGAAESEAQTIWVGSIPDRIASEPALRKVREFVPAVFRSLPLSSSLPPPPSLSLSLSLARSLPLFFTVFHALWQSDRVLGFLLSTAFLHSVLSLLLLLLLCSVILLYHMQQPDVKHVAAAVEHRCGARLLYKLLQVLASYGAIQKVTLRVKEPPPKNILDQLADGDVESGVRQSPGATQALAGTSSTKILLLH